MVGGLAIGARRLIGDRYELEAPIGKGGIGEVWRARHVALNSRVAIKFLQLASAEKELAKRRFTTEAQITAQLKTPNAVQVFDFGITDDGQPYLVMELLEGETLGRRLEPVGRLGILETAVLLGQAARALQRAHQLGIVHRDFKPDNVVICADDEGRDQVKVLDFGVAKLVGALEEGADRESGEGLEAAGSAPSFTKTGMVLGTPLYMAPEQVRNAAEVDLRADIWAFGVVAFQCLTGRAPFNGATLAELFERIQGGLHPRADFLDPTVPPAFDMWFDIACAPDPSKRFPLASVAYKHLTVALDVMRDNSGSFPGVLDPHASSGERRVVVVRPSGRPDAIAATIDARSTTSSGEVRSRTHGDEFASLQRIPLPSIELRVPGDSPAAIARERAMAPPAVVGLWRAPWRIILAGAVVLGVVSAGVALRNVTTRTAAATASSTTAPIPAGAPVSALVATAVTEPLPAPQATPSATTAPPPEPTTSAHRASPLRPAPHSASALSAATTPPPLAPPPPDPPPATAKSTVDPGSYR